MLGAGVCWPPLRVDVAALRQLIAGRLQLIRGGASVEEAALPWPTIAGAAASPASAASAGRRPPPSLFPGSGEVLPSVEAVWRPITRMREQLRAAAH